jgi:mono/diheme cytochrome c family protein
VGPEDVALDDTSDSLQTDPRAETTTALPGLVLEAQTQRPGNPESGFEALAYKGYVGCGIPKTLYTIAEAAGAGFAGPPLPGRDSELPYFLTEYTDPRGFQVVGPNCMSCHADHINGNFVMGLGSTTLHFGGLAGQVSSLAGLLPQVQGFVSPDEFAELEKFVQRMVAVAPYIQPRTAGVNPADNLAAILFAHRDPLTLAWSEELLLEPPPMEVVALDVPPWWRMAKKSSMLYSAGGRGDHARIMMAASTLCVDSVEEAAEIDSWFPDVRAYLMSLSPPDWPWDVNVEQAAVGEGVFTAHCAICHGTYDEGAHTYPNLWIDIDLVGTDDVLAVGGAQLATRFVEWFNASFYGEAAHLDPKPGYVPPPLDGIWATAPFLHNGSVPTLAALLDSSIRPMYWRRSSFSNSDYDADQMGWAFQSLEAGQDAEPNESMRVWIYDTTLPGYGNGGHTFGDPLSVDERAALLEYLKTL